MGYTESKETAKAKAKRKSWIPVSGFGFLHRSTAYIRVGVTGMTMLLPITACIFCF